jgi:hypothetical protein
MEIIAFAYLWMFTIFTKISIFGLKYWRSFIVKYYICFYFQDYDYLM